MLPMLPQCSQCSQYYFGLTQAPLRTFAEGLGDGGATATAASGISLLHASMAVCLVAVVALCLGLVVGRIVQRPLHTREQRVKLEAAAFAQRAEAASNEYSDSDSRPLVPPL